MDASGYMALAGLGLGATSAYMSNRQRNRDRELAAEEADLDRADRRETNILDVASRESLADPFRHQGNQIDVLGRLDRIANAQRGQTTINVPPEMARFMPQRSGGYSYEASPDLRTSAQLLARSVASGETAPTMTNPANYGMTGAKNLNDPNSIGMGARPNAPSAPMTPGAGGAIPRSPSIAPLAGPGASGVSPRGATAGSPGYSTKIEDDVMNADNPAYANYRRRREGAGGAGSGAKKGLTYGMALGPAGMAGGALIGGIAGGITNNAESAYSDFFLEDAKQILRDESERMWGQPATEEQIDEAIAGQGWKPGHRWVGQESLDYILDRWGERVQQPDDEDEVFTPSYSGLFA